MLDDDIVDEIVENTHSVTAKVISVLQTSGSDYSMDKSENIVEAMKAMTMKKNKKKGKLGEN